jgi:hypothetical protein
MSQAELMLTYIYLLLQANSAAQRLVFLVLLDGNGRLRFEDFDLS